MKKCPYCAEKIQEDARKCRYCGEWIADERTQQSSTVNNAPPKQEKEVTPEVIEMPELAKKPSINDIPKFALGKFYIYSTLIWAVFFIVAVSINTLLFFRSMEVKKIIFDLLLVLCAGIDLFIVLGLRKRKKYALYVTCCLLAVLTFGGITHIFIGDGIFMQRLGRGALIAWISFGWLVYFFARRKYFY